MKVKELIAQLKTYPGDLEVLLPQEGGYGFAAVVFVAKIDRSSQPIPQCGNYTMLSSDWPVHRTVGNPFDALIIDLDDSSLANAIKRLWLDDVRSPPDESWHWVKTAAEAIATLDARWYAEISLDHDLGEQECGTGYAVAAWIEEQAVMGNWWKVPGVIQCHSANPVGIANIQAAIDSINRQRQAYWTLPLKESP